MKNGKLALMLVVALGFATGTQDTVYGSKGSKRRGKSPKRLAPKERFEAQERDVHRARLGRILQQLIAAIKKFEKNNPALRGLLEYTDDELAMLPMRGLSAAMTHCDNLIEITEKLNIRGFSGDAMDLYEDLISRITGTYAKAKALKIALEKRRSPKPEAEEEPASPLKADFDEEPRPLRRIKSSPAIMTLRSEAQGPVKGKTGAELIDDAINAFGKKHGFNPAGKLVLEGLGQQELHPIISDYANLINAVMDVVHRYMFTEDEQANVSSLVKKIYDNAAAARKQAAQEQERMSK